ncbi:MAG: AbrB/MazE/SpoVT family DNA-binding domain-containing protein [bacterium]
MIKNLKDFEARFYDVVTVGERGQVVIPSNARKALGIKAGDKLLALEGPMGSTIVFMRMKSMNLMLEKAMKALSKIKGKIGE